MPGMSGLELLPKANAMRPDVPIIMISACGDAETKRLAGERRSSYRGKTGRGNLWPARRSVTLSDTLRLGVAALQTDHQTHFVARESLL